MSRNLVMCLDGTAGQVRGDGDSNVVRIYDLLDFSDSTKQVAYYDPGVGTFASPGAWTPFARAFSRLGGLIWGGGLRQNLGEAYTWLMREWRPGDAVYIFGFSRGAFTARALAGMLAIVGLMRPGSENQVQYAVSTYARRGGEAAIPWDEIHRFAAVFAQTIDGTPGGKTGVPVHYLGLWDTVKALGVARLAPNWPYTRKLPNAERIRHAVSIDERRRPFAEYPVRLEKAPERLEELWFTGVHTDVGGSHEDDSRLSTITLKWVLEGAVESGLIVDPKAVRSAFRKLDERYAEGAAHRNNPIWALLVWRRREIPEGAVLHASVRERMSRLTGSGGYRPKLPKAYSWADDGWATHPEPEQPAAKARAEASAAHGIS